MNTILLTNDCFPEWHRGEEMCSAHYPFNNAILLFHTVQCAPLHSDPLTASTAYCCAAAFRWTAFSWKTDGGWTLRMTLNSPSPRLAPPDSEPYVKLQLHVFIKHQTVFPQAWPFSQQSLPQHWEADWEIGSPELGSNTPFKKQATNDAVTFSFSLKCESSNTRETPKQTDRVCH